MDEAIQRLINDLEELRTQHTLRLVTEWYRGGFTLNGVTVRLEMKQANKNNTNMEMTKDVFEDKLLEHGAFKQASWTHRS